MRSVRRLKAYQKVALVAATAVVGGFVVAAVTFASVNNARNHLRDVERHSGPQTALLERLTAEVTADRLALGGASTAAAKATRTLKLQEALDVSGLASTDWNVYQHNALGLSGESALAKQYGAFANAANAQGRTVGLEILASPEGTAAPRSANLLLLLGSVEGQLSQAQKLTDLYVTHTGAEITETLHRIKDAERNGLIAFAIAMLIGLGISWISIRDTRLQELDQERMERERAEGTRRTAFDHRLGMGLDMVRSEADAFTVFERALVEVVDDLPVELLIADSSMSHFRRTIAVDAEGTHGCDVSTPDACPATRAGQTRLFESSTSLEACPHLATSATPCVRHCAYRSRPAVSRSASSTSRDRNTRPRAPRSLTTSTSWPAGPGSGSARCACSRTPRPRPAPIRSRDS